jgi:hypothetical protein
VIAADFVTVPKVAERRAHPVAGGIALNWKVALRKPGVTTTEPGAINRLLVDFMSTTTALVRVEVTVMVQVPPPPGATVVGEQVIEERGDNSGESTRGKETTVCPT